MLACLAEALGVPPTSFISDEQPHSPSAQAANEQLIFSP